MSLPKDDYSYWLTVSGSLEDRKAVHELLQRNGILGKKLEAAATVPPLTSYQVPEVWGTIEEWDELELEEAFHSIAVAVPGATLHLNGCNETNKVTQFEKRFHGDLFQQTRSVTTMPPLRDDADIPFAQRHEQHMTLPSQKIYLFCEEKEGEDAIRQFTVHAVSTDRDALRQLLRAKVEKDEYGYFAMEEQELPEEGKDYAFAESDNEFVEYYVSEHKVLTREQALQRLQTPEYSTTFEFPEGFRGIALEAIWEYLDEQHFCNVNCDKVADDLMNDRKFQAEVKQAWWFRKKLSDAGVQHAAVFCTSSLCDKLSENPDYLVSIGAMPAFNPPENLKDIVIDCIYDVCKANHLPVRNAELQAERFMWDPSFRSTVQKIFPNVKQLKPDTKEYLHAVWLCTALVSPHLLDGQGKNAREDKGPSLAALIQIAQERQTAGDKEPTGQEKETTR